MKKKCLLKLLPLLLCGCLLMQPLAALAASLGDADGDGSVTAADARLALRAAVGLEQYEKGSERFSACDADRSGEITAADARLILRAAVGLETLSEQTPGNGPYVWERNGSMVLLDTQEIKVCMDPYVSAEDGLHLEFYCNAKYVDNAPFVVIDNVSMNGYMLPLDLEIRPEEYSTEKTFGTLLVPSAYLDWYGSPADEITFGIYVYYGGMEEIGPQYYRPVTLYPTGKTAATVSYPDRYETEEEDVLCSTDKAEIVYRGATSFPGENVLLYLDFYLENRSDRNQVYVFYVHEINGEETELPISVFVTAGKRADAAVILFADETGIPDGTEIFSVGMTTAVFYDDGSLIWQAEF